jgi:hypothetical protein
MSIDLNKEKILTGFVIVTILLVLVMGLFKVQLEIFILLYAVALSLLLGHYLFNATRIFYKLIMLGLFAGVFMYFLIFMEWPYSIYFFMAGTAAQFIFGASILYKGIRDSINTKDFEIFIYLLGGLLMITALVNVMPGFYLLFFNKRLLLDNAEFLPFPLVGVIITIMANENLWNDFLPEEKKLLVFITLLQIIPLATVLLHKFMI